MRCKRRCTRTLPSAGFWSKLRCVSGGGLKGVVPAARVGRRCQRSSDNIHWDSRATTRRKCGILWCKFSLDSGHFHRTLISFVEEAKHLKGETPAQKHPTAHLRKLSSPNSHPVPRHLDSPKSREIPRCHLKIPIPLPELKPALNSPRSKLRKIHPVNWIPPLAPPFQA